MHITNENLDCCLITLFVSDVCNYKCSYCDEEHNGGMNPWPKDWTPYIDFINSVKKENKYIYLEILGGEPSVWPNFVEFVQTISDENVFVEFGSNGSRTLKYWKRFPKLRAWMFQSWHYEFADDDHFCAVAEIMQDKINISVPLMITPANFERAVALFERLKKYRIEITPKLTRQRICSTTYFDYSKEQIAWITNHYHNAMKPFGIDWIIPRNLHFNGIKKRFMKVLAEGLHNFHGYTCLAGTKKFYVDIDGAIKRCTKGVNGPVGNIFKYDYKVNNGTVVCNKNACTCKLDAVIEKWI